MIEYMMDLIIHQNKELLKTIAVEESLDYQELCSMIPSHKDVITYIHEQSLQTKKKQGTSTTATPVTHQR